MRAPWMVVLLGAVLATGAVAQADVSETDTAGAERLRSEIERRFFHRLQADLELTPDQVKKLQATQSRLGPRRRQLRREGMGYRMALQREMRPGVAANADSVQAYMDGLQRVRAAQVALDAEEDRELARYLTPVQRARFQMMRTRLLQRANEIRRERQRQGQGRAGPRGRP